MKFTMKSLDVAYGELDAALKSNKRLRAENRRLRKALREIAARPNAYHLLTPTERDMVAAAERALAPRKRRSK